MNNTDLLTGLKSTLLIPKDVDTFDELLKTFILGAKSFVDGILDQQPTNDELYNLTVIYLAQYYYLNRDNGKLRTLPVTVNSLLNRLKFKYQN